MTDYPDIEKAIASLERQIDDLRHQSSSLATDLSHRAGHRTADLRSRARNLSAATSSGWRDADRYARRGAHQMADFARENPGTLSTAGLAAAGLIGLGVWWLLRPHR